MFLHILKYERNIYETHTNDEDKINNIWQCIQIFIVFPISLNRTEINWCLSIQNYCNGTYDTAIQANIRIML